MCAADDALARRGAAPYARAAMHHHELPGMRGGRRAGCGDRGRRRGLAHLVTAALASRARAASAWMDTTRRRPGRCSDPIQASGAIPGIREWMEAQGRPRPRRRGQGGGAVKGTVKWHGSQSHGEDAHGKRRQLWDARPRAPRPAGLRLLGVQCIDDELGRRHVMRAQASQRSAVDARLSVHSDHYVPVKRCIYEGRHHIRGSRTAVQLWSCFKFPSSCRAVGVSATASSCAATTVTRAKVRSNEFHKA